MGFFSEEDGRGCRRRELRAQIEDLCGRIEDENEKKAALLFEISRIDAVIADLAALLTALRGKTV